MKVLFVGLGSIGQRHLRNLAALAGPGLEILAYRALGRPGVLNDHLEVEPGAVLERRYGLRVFPTLAAALAESPRLAFICNPTRLHAETALRAAEAGCHLFIEKPLSDSLDGIEDLRRVCRERRLTVQIAQQLRFHPGLRELHRLLEERRAGDLITVRCEVGERLTDWHKYEDYRRMYAARRDLGGGVVLTQIHELDYLYWFFGMPERVYAVGGKLSDLDVDVEDAVGAVLTFRRGGRPFPVLVQMDYVQRPPARSCKVVGTRGTITLDLVRHRVEWLSIDDASPEVLDFPGFDRNAMFNDELKQFLRCVETGERPAVDLEDGIRGLEIALAVKRSLAEGRPVEPAETALR